MGSILTRTIPPCLVPFWWVGVHGSVSLMPHSAGMFPTVTRQGSVSICFKTNDHVVHAFIISFRIVYYALSSYLSGAPQSCSVCFFLMTTSQTGRQTDRRMNKQTDSQQDFVRA